MGLMTRRGFTAGVLASVFSRAAVAQSAPVVHIGLLVPRTGAPAAVDVGERVVKGAQAAAAWLNGKDLPGAPQLVIDIEDNGGTAKGAASAANRVLSNGTDFVIGYGSDTELAAAEKYRDNDILPLTISNADALTPDPTVDPGAKFLRLVPRNADYACRIVSLISDRARVAIIYDSSLNGSEMAAQVSAGLRARGVALGSDRLIKIDPSATDFSADLTTLRAALGKGGRVFLATNVGTAGRIIRQSADYAPDLGFIGHSTLVYQALADEAHDRVVDTDIIAASPPDLSGVDASVLAALGADRALDLEMMAFTGVLLIHNGVRQALAAQADKTRLPKASTVRRLLLSQDHKTPTGLVGFTADGNLKYPNLSHYVWKRTPERLLRPLLDQDFPPACG